jgi:Ca2+-binding EF-hand superfamily protein
LSPADMMFEAIDENADGEISAAEYRQLIEA